MAPKITRPRSDRAHWPVAAACGVAALIAGYVGAAKVFRPDIQPGSAEGDEGAGGGAVGEGPAPGAGADAGRAAAEPAVIAPVAEPQAAPPPPPRVRVRVVRAVLQSCGDGEELTTPGERCEPVAGLEEALRAHLPQLGNCPSAEQAALHQPDSTLSIGLRVDFARHRVTALPGRSSSVRDPLTYVPCARAAMEHADALWRLTAPHPRYLMFFMVRFGPGLEPGATPAAAGAGASDAGSAAAPETPAAPSGAGTPGGESGNAGAGTPGAGAETPGAGTPPAPTPAATSGASPAPSATNASPAPSAAADAGPAGAPAINAVPLRRPETVQVAWDRALIREWPQTGAVRARLSRGTELTAVARSGSWYQVRWSGGEGWVFGEAIGR